MRLGVLTLALLFGCQENGGAVSVRWEIVDLTRGSLIKPNDVEGPDGSCGHQESDMSPLRSWSISRVRLVIADLTTGAEVLSSDDPRLLFKCSQREATTAFSLPLGTFAMSLQAVNNGVDDPDVVTPAPAVRTLKRAELVNLDVVELGIHPVPLAPTETPDMSVGDGGPVM